MGSKFKPTKSQDGRRAQKGRTVPKYKLVYVQETEPIDHKEGATADISSIKQTTKK